MSDEIAKERDRYRAALEEILGLAPPDDLERQHNPDDFLLGLGAACDIARAALESDQP